MSSVITYLRIFNVLILMSQIVANPLPFKISDIKSSFFNFCGGALASVRKFRDDIKSFFTSSTCKLEEKRQELKNLFSQFLNKSAGTVLNKIPSFKKSSKNNNNEESSTTPVPKNQVRRSGLNAYETFGKSLALNVVSVNGHMLETHTVITPDGYILTLHRIPRRDSQSNEQSKNRTAILHHGLLGSSMDWMLSGPNISLAYLLTNAGYDVWLANARGNKYSKAHVTKSVHSPEYWDYSWHEIGLYDLSSTIDYVREQTLGKSQIVFIAHSMGATALMVLLSTSPQYNSILSLVILLAPLVFMQQAKGPIRLLSEFQNLDYNATVKILGGDQFNPSEDFMKVLIRKFCKGDGRLCENPILLLSDGGKAITNTDHMKNIVFLVTPRGSTKTIMHYGQLINSGRFEMFDGGSEKNIKKYGIASPPKYHLRDLKLPVVLFSSHDDWLSTPPDILNLLSHLHNPVVHHIVQKNGSSKEFSHFDFIWSKDAHSLVYKYIFDILDQY